MTEIDKILDKNSMTADEFLLCLSKGCITKDCVGMKVILPNKLSNAEVSPQAYNEVYEIADVSHDYVYGAVDLVSFDVINKGEPIGLQNDSAPINSTTAYYIDSYIDKWLNNEFYNGFADNVKAAMVDMLIESNGSVVNRKVKLLSEPELGTGVADMLVEGHAYPIFEDDRSRIKYETYKEEGKSAVSRPVIYWTRSRALNFNGYMMTISEEGKGVVCYWFTNTFGIVPAMRFMNALDRFPNEYLRKRKLTESELITFAATVGFTKDFIGKEVIITNNGIEEIYEIADIDHDRHCGSLDLISKDVIANGKKISFGDFPTSYDTSNLRKYLNTEYYNGFADGLKAVMQSMLCTNPFDLNHPMADKVRALSSAELGLEDENDYSDGNKYDLFDPDRPSTMTRGTSYLLRSIASKSAGMTYAYGYPEGSSEPTLFQTSCTVEHLIVPTIRIKNNSGCDQILARDWIYSTEFIYCLERNVITEEHIGKTIDIWSSACDYRTYIIADVNHDGVENTVDVIAVDPVVKFRQFDSSDQNKNYSQSGIRQFLNNDYYNGLDDTVKKRLAPFTIYRNDIINKDENGNSKFVEEKDYVRLLTCTEVGFEEYSHLDENDDPDVGCKYDKGTLYPIFSDNNSRLKYIDFGDRKMPREYWLMTPYDASTDVMGVSEFGGYGAYRPTNNLGVVTVMRFYQGDLPASDPEPSVTEQGIDVTESSNTNPDVNPDGSVG